MTVQKVLEVGDPELRRIADLVPAENLGKPEFQALIDDLIETMRARNGAGLAATQIGEAHRICVVEVGDNPRYPYKPKIPLTVLVNPVIEALTEETFDNYEGCLSVPNLRGLVPRSTQIRISFLDRNGLAHSQIVGGLSAGTYQHEVDHLDGLLFLDRVVDRKSLTTWDAFEKFHKAGFVARVEALVERFGE